MPNILFLTSNKDFYQDLSGQIALYAKDFQVIENMDSSLAIDLIILDENRQQINSLRQQHPKAPIILLQKQKDANIQESVLNSIIYKPLSLENLLNQIRSKLVLLDNSTDGYLYFNQYELRPLDKEIYNERNGETIKLTEKEVAIIKFLYKNKDKIVSKNDLLQEVWGYSPDVSTHTIETHIYRLRQKVEHEDTSAQLIVTEDGGYKLVL